MSATPLETYQLDDLRADIGDTNDPPAFENSQLQRNWARVAAATTFESQWRACMALCYRQLLASAVKLHDYTAGAAEEKLSQVYSHLEDQLKKYEPDLNAVLGKSQQMTKAHLRPVPRQDRYTPDEQRSDVYRRDRRYD